MTIREVDPNAAPIVDDVDPKIKSNIGKTSAGLTTFLVPAKPYRCNDAYHSPDNTYPELKMPDDYSVHTTHGVGVYVRTALKSAWVLSEIAGFDRTDINIPPRGPIDVSSFWYLFETSEDEGSEGLNKLRSIIEEKVLASYDSSRVAFNITYAITLVYALVLFLWPFASVRKDLLNEARHNRGILFMVPMNVVAKSKPIIEYVERVFEELNN